MSKEFDIFLTGKVLEDTPAVYRSERFAMNTDTLMNGSTVKNHFQQQFQSKVWIDERGETHGMDHHPAVVSSERVERQERRDPYFLKRQKSC